MARLVVGAVGAVIGFYIGGPVGALQGFAIGYGLSAGLDPNSKQLGPKLSDLKAPAAAYGSPIPYVEGAPRLAGVFFWASEKREIATTTSSGGKGGPGVDSTIFTYEIDAIIGVAINPCEAIRRIWSNGRLVWSNADGSTAETLTASAVTNSWRAIRFNDGNPDQLPEPLYEAAIGVGNAPAFRGRSTVTIEGMNLGGSGQLPVLTFEVLSEADPSATAVTFADVPVTQLTYPAIVGQGSSPFSATGFLVHIGQWDSNYSNAEVWVYAVATDGTASVIDTYTASANEPSGHGQTDRAGIMASGGILFGAFDQTKLYWDEKDQPEDIVSRYEWNLPSIGDWLGGAQVRFCMRGDDVVFASSNFGTQRLYRYSKADGLLIGGGTPTVISAVLPYNFDALATDGTLLYALRYTFRIVEVYDLATLTLQDTLPDPGSGGSSGNGSVVVDEDGVLFLINGNAAPTNRSVYRWDGSAWHEDYAGVVLGATNSLSQYGIANGIVFQMTSPDPYLVQRVTAYYRTIAIADVTLDQVVRRLCLRTGLLTDDDIDVTDLASGVAIADGIVHAFAISQVSTTRASLEILMAGYLFECVENDKLTFVRRGGSSALTVPYADLAAGPDGQSEPLPLKRLNDIEIAARVSVKFANIQNDFQDGLVQADRLVTDSTAESIVELPIGFTPAEAAKLADANTMDNAVKLLQIGPISLPRSYSALEPTDVITLTNLDGSTFRARIMKGTIGAGVNTFELVLDDATVINSEAVTDEDYASSSLVRLLGSTQLVPMDIAPLSDALSGIGYIAAFGAEGSWPGADLDESLDNVTYAKILAVGDLAVMGTASTVLGDFTGGNVFDERNSLTVDVGEGTLSSTTRDLMLTTDVNPLAVGSNANGWEVIQFRTASYVSPGVYTLSGFLRGRRGTEWTMAGHVASERVVFLQTTGLRHVDDTFADIGVPYYLKAVTHGQSVAAAPSQLFTDTGVSQMPFAPVDLRIDAAREVTWHRRSRLASRFLAVVDPPLGEVTELYDVELRDGADVLVESDTVTDPSYALVYGGSLTGYSFTVWMKSATVGRGYPATLEF